MWASPPPQLTVRAWKSGNCRAARGEEEEDAAGWGEAKSCVRTLVVQA